ncbi:MAG: hypothetical protein ACPKOP_07745 [Sphaerochaetaceae bacterium]
MFENFLPYRQENATLFQQQFGRSKQIAHSLLLHGSRFTGRMSFALEIARILSCRHDGKEDCICPSCKEFNFLTMSNVVILSHRDHNLRISAAFDLFEKLETEMSRRILIRQIRIMLMAYHVSFAEQSDSKKSAQFSKASDVDMLLRDFQDTEIQDSLKLAKELEKNVNSLIQGNSGNITIDQIRQVAKWTSKTSFDRTSRFIILENIESAAVGANNSLLKMLEEPAPGTYIILISEHPNRLLPTIRSRVQSHHIVPLTVDERKRVFENFFFADYHHYDSIEQFVLFKAGLPLEQIEKTSRDYIGSIISKNALNSRQLGDICTLVDEKNHLDYFISMVDKNLSSHLNKGNVTVNDVIRIQTAMNETFQKGELFNQQRKVLVEMLYYRLLEEL